MDVVWTIEREKQLKDLRATGLSCREIAAEMGCFGDYVDHGRSAVIGKIHRLKLPLPLSREAPKGYAMPGKRPLPRAQPQRRNPSRNILAAMAIAMAEPGLPQSLKGEIPDGTGIKLHQLTKITCRWPIGDPKTTEFEFCGARPFPGLPYCLGHCSRAYRS